MNAQQEMHGLHNIKKDSQMCSTEPIKQQKNHNLQHFVPENRVKLTRISKDTKNTAVH